MASKLHIWKWTVTAFLSKHAKVIIAALVVGITTAFLSPYIPLEKFSHKATRIGRTSPPTVSDIPMDIQSIISPALIKLDKSGNYNPDAVISITQPDEKTYDLTLNQNLTWNNHQAFNSNDIEYNIADVTIERPAPNQIRFILKEPFAPFLSLLTQPIVKRNKIGFIRKRTILEGLNGFVLNVTKVNGNYIKELTLTKDNTKIIYTFYNNEEEALIDFKLGKVDVLEHMSADYLSDWPKVSTLKEVAVNQQLVLFFNLDKPVFQDKTFRQSLAYATPKKTDDERIISPISKVSYAYNPQVKPYLYNIEAAKTILSKLKTKPAKITLSTIPTYQEYADRIAESWHNLGIPTEVKVEAFPDTNDYEVLLIGQQIPKDPDQYLLWHSTKSSNITHYNNPKVDKLLEDGRKTSKQVLRKEYYQEFQRVLVEDCPVVFLHELPRFTIVRGKSDPYKALLSL